ncbi:MAG: LPS assembly lipoprotein LptE [Candidatus Methylomirabilia bacterium]
MSSLARRLALIVLLLGGCGYSLSGTLPGHIKSVGVPVFANRTQKPAVENFITRAVIDAFTTDSRLRVVRPESADSVLEGEIVDYRIEALAFDPRANVREYRVSVTLNVSFRDVKNNATLWREEGLRHSGDFRVSGQVAETISREETALRQAAVDIGRTIVNRAITRF